jgi:ATP-dependent RNA helicase DDX27
MAIILGLLGLKACELHGNLSQTQRIQAFLDFKEGKFDFLLATDLASRGLDIKDVKTVINFELPSQLTKYIHRIGRTARAGNVGTSLTICSDL